LVEPTVEEYFHLPAFVKKLSAANGGRFVSEVLVVGLAPEISNDSTAGSVVMSLSLVAEDEADVFEMLDSVLVRWSCLVSISTTGVVEDDVRVRLTDDWSGWWEREK